jgi:hypothetical protein
MKTYTLEVFLDKVGVSVHEKTSEGFDVVECRLIISVLEEYKQRLLNEIMIREKETDLKKNIQQ